MVKASIKGLCDNVYPLTIDYDLELEELEKMGQYDKSICIIDPNSKPPTANQGPKFAMFELIHLNRRVSNIEAEKTLRKFGYYPADIYALLTFGMNYPHIQSVFSIAAIAYSLKVYYKHTSPRKYGMVGLPFLVGDGKERIFDFKSEDGEWSEMTRFLATRNKSMRTGSIMKHWKWW